MIRKLRDRNPEEGFTMTEVAMALGILVISLLALAQTALVGFRDTALGRQRQTANQIANQLLEEVRGLAYDHVTRGLADADLAGDLNIVDCGGLSYFRVCPPDPDAEPIVHTPGLATVSPLVPHRGSFGAPDYPNTFGWSVYVTGAQDAPEAGAFRVWAMVEWTNGTAGVRNSVETQTMIFAPSGCLDTATHPFGAPCQAFHQGSATIKGGGTVTTGLAETAVYDAFVVDLLSLGATAQTEQVGLVDGAVSLPGGRRIVGGVTTDVGRLSRTTQADTDPSTPAGVWQSESIGSNPPGSAAVVGGGTQVTVTAAGTDTYSTTSTTAADASNPCTTQNDLLACAYDTGNHAGETAPESGVNLFHTIKIPEDGGTATLVRVGRDPTSSVTYTRRALPVAGQDGLVRASVERRIPEVRLMGLPVKATAPAGWAGYLVRLTNYTATLQAESGTNTSAPTVSVTGVVEYWNGAGYSTAVVGAGTQVLTVASVSVPVSGVGYGAGSVQIGGTLEIKGTSTSQQADGTTRIEAKASAGPPLFGEFTYRVFRGGNLLADLTVVVDLGRATAQTTYAAAPTP